MKRVGIYAGTFDPVHNGHIAFALEAAEKHDLDKVFLLVEPNPRRKQGVKALEHRVKMVEQAVKDYPKLGTIHIDQARFTVHETTPILKSRFEPAELYLLIADDVLKHLISWPHVDELYQNFTFIVAARQRTVYQIARTLDNIKVARNVDIKWRVMSPSKVDISSSKVKVELRKQGYSRGIDSKVLDYIKANNLYFADGE